jgi:protoheme IX farnesyltransferase
VGHAVVLLLVSLALVPLGIAGWLYGGVALALGAWLLLRGVRAVGVAGARAFFRATLVYLPALALSLVLDRWLAGGGS